MSASEKDLLEAIQHQLEMLGMQVDRLLDLRHASRLDQLEGAFRALGKQLSVQVSEAA